LPANWAAAEPRKEDFRLFLKTIAAQASQGLRFVHRQRRLFLQLPLLELAFLKRYSLTQGSLKNNTFSKKRVFECFN
jgi:hypothetical protein